MQQPIQHLLLAEVCDYVLSSVCTHVTSKITICDKTFDRLRETLGIANRDQYPGLTIHHDFATPSDIGGHHRQFHSRGLHARAWNSFSMRRENEEIHRAIPLPHVAL